MPDTTKWYTIKWQKNGSLASVWLNNKKLFEAS